MHIAFGALSLIFVLAAHMANAQNACQTRQGDPKRLLMERLALADPRTHQQLSRLKDKESLFSFIDTKERDLAIATCTHEGLHMLSAEENVYHFYDGSTRPRMRDIAFQPREILKQVQNSSVRDALSSYTDTYLIPGQASSAELFEYLLDEMNAYSRELITFAKLKAHGCPQPEWQHSQRDGTAAMMLYFKLALQRAKDKHPGDWRRLKSSENLKTLRALWDQAEVGLRDTCSASGIGIEDKAILASVYSSANSDALSEIIGRRPQSPCDGQVSTETKNRVRQSKSESTR